MGTHVVSQTALERMLIAVEKVRERMLRATAAVRNTQDVDILIRRSDLERVKDALAPAHLRVLLDNPDG